MQYAFRKNFKSRKTLWNAGFPNVQPHKCVDIPNEMVLAQINSHTIFSMRFTMLHTWTFEKSFRDHNNFCLPVLFGWFLVSELVCLLPVSPVWAPSPSPGAATENTHFVDCKKFNKQYINCVASLVDCLEGSPSLFFFWAFSPPPSILGQGRPPSSGTQSTADSWRPRRGCWPGFS